MIFRKGELVEVIYSLHASTEKYLGQVGKVEKVNNLEQDEAPFLVFFFLNGKKESCTFTHDELRLADGAKDAQKRQRFFNQARLHRM